MVIITYDILNKIETNIPFPIYKYDSNDTIAEKIFISAQTDIDIIRLYYKYIIIDAKNFENGNITINYYSLHDYILKNNIIYKFNLLNLRTHSIDNLDIAIDYIYKNIKKIDTLSIQSLFVFILKNDFNKDIKHLIDISLNNYKKLQKNLYELYNKEYINIKSIKISNINKVIPFDKNDMPKYNIKNINLINILKSEDKSKQYYINIIKLYKSFPLSNKIPFMVINIGDTPSVKIYEKFSNKKEILGWILNDKNKIKSTKGIYMKYIHSDNLQVNINIFTNGEVNISIDNSGIINFTKLLDLNKTIISNLINTISKYFLNLETKLHNVFIKVLYFTFTIYSDINISQLSRIVDNNKKFYRLVANTNDSMKISYKSHTIMILRKYKHNNNTYFEVNSSVKYNNDYYINEEFINSVIFDTSLLFLQKPIKRTTNSIELIDSISKLKFTIEDKNTANIKILRKKGIINKAINCQKFRQPIIAKSTFKQKTGYPLEYNNNIYICPNKKVPYPGITVTNDICCFKKDQRNKPIFKQFFKKDSFQIDYNILQTNILKHIIKTNKLLDFGRLAIFTNPLFDNKTYYRLGNYNNYYSLLHIFNVVFKTNNNIDNLISKLTKEKYNTLNISTDIEYEDLHDKLQNPDNTILEHKYIIELLCDYYNINCFIISNNYTKSNTKNIIEYYQKNNKDKVILISKFENVGYELIVDTDKQMIYSINDTLIISLLRYIKFIPNNLNYSTSTNIYTKYLSNLFTKQIVSLNNNVIYFYTTIYGLLPINWCKSKMIDSIKTINLGDTEFKTLLLPYDTQLIKLYKFISKFPELKQQYNPISYIIHPNNKVILGIKCNNGLIIPVKEEKFTQKKKTNLSIEYSYFYYDFYNSLEQDFNDSRIKSIFVFNYYNELLLRLKLQISLVITKKEFESIESLLYSNISFIEKFNSINNILTNSIKNNIIFKSLLPNKPVDIPLSRIDCNTIYCINNKLGIEEKYFKFFMNIITNEILNGNTDIKNKKINIEIEDKNQFIVRQYEKVFTNLAELKSFIHLG